jgi:hypothetical protein
MTLINYLVLGAGVIFLIFVAIEFWEHYNKRKEMRKH